MPKTQVSVERIIAFAFHTAKYQKECKNCLRGTILGHEKPRDKPRSDNEIVVNLEGPQKGYPMVLCREHCEWFEVDHKCDMWKAK